ncbi:MAG: TetR/AcrR family transcriptional regulator [Candidatus Promineifilaceae bacterium]|nr:TetR/AcrR family transcriptional regulator [Candidatus Promineifilaceae bacterium]
MPRTIATHQILDAALDVITKRGYAGATTREMAAAAGINEVTLFRRFGSKKGVLMAAVEQEAGKLSAGGMTYSGDLQADLLRVVRFYQQLMAQHGRLLVMLLSEAPRQPELLEAMQTPLAIIEKIEVLIRRYQREGVLVEEPPGQAFAALVGPLFLCGALGELVPALMETPFDPVAHVHGYLQGRLKASLS